MDEELIKERIRELISKTHMPTYFSLLEDDRNGLLAQCVTFAETDWTLDNKLFARVKEYVLHENFDTLKALGTEIKGLLCDFYEAHLDDLYYECIGEIETAKNEENGLKKTIDNENGEPIWR